MSLAVVNACTLLPNAHNWSSRPRLSLAYDSAIAGGLTGAEDRQAGTASTKRSMDWQATTLEQRESQRLAARLKAALASGRAAAPIWPRQQAITGAVTDHAHTTGLWPWATGDYAFFGLHGIPNGEQLDALVNCGGAAATGWLADKWGTGGEAVTTEDTPDTSGLTGSGLPTPPAAVYQAARNYSGETPGSIVYTIPNLQPGVACRVRLHFCEIGSGFDRSCFMRLQNVTVSGATPVLNFEPFAWADYVPLTAMCMDIVTGPDASGCVTVKIETTRRELVAVAVANVANPAALTSLDGVALHAGDCYGLFGQDDARTNGVYVHGSYPQRAAWANDINALNGLEVYVRDPAIHGGTWYRCSNSGTEWVLGTSNINFPESQNTLHYHATISGIEFYQHAWDCVALISGTTTGELHWAGGWLKGIYDNQIVFPMIYGRLVADKLEAVTGHVGDIALAIREPISVDSGLVRSACAMEVCDGNGWDELAEYYPLLSEPYPTGSSTFTSYYAWSAASLSSAQTNFLKHAALYDFPLHSGGNLGIDHVIGIHIAPIPGTAHYVDCNNKWTGGDFTFNYAADDAAYGINITTGLAIQLIYMP